MKGFTGIYSVETTGFHGVIEKLMNVGGKVFKKVECGYIFEKREKINIGKIIGLAIIFFLTIPTLVIMAFCRLSLNPSQINTPLPKDNGVELDGDRPEKIGGGWVAAAATREADEPKMDELRKGFQKMLAKIKHREIEQKASEFTKVSEILNLNGGKIFLHGMAVDNWGGTQVQNTVVDQGRQNPLQFEWPLEKHKGLKGAEVYYFHPDLEKMDLLITLNQTAKTEKSDQEGEEIAIGIIEVANTLEGVTLDAFTIYSEGIEVRLADLSYDDRVKVLTDLIKEHAFKVRPLKLIMNFDHGREGEIEGAIREAIPATLLRDIKSAKDCTTSYFSGEEGKESIKGSIRFIVDKLSRQESISVFCQQGKDRSAALVFAALLYLSGSVSKQNQLNVLQYLREKRTIVSDFEKPTEQKKLYRPDGSCCNRDVSGRGGLIL